jgi:hypothetical protein
MKHLLFAVLATAALIAPVQAHVIDVCKVRSSDGYANARILKAAAAAVVDIAAPAAAVARTSRLENMAFSFTCIGGTSLTASLTSTDLLALSGQAHRVHRRVQRIY